MNRAFRAFALFCGFAASAHKTLNLNQDVANLIHTTRILYPSAPGSYPVLTFLHGFALDISVYDKILSDASEKAIVILFQMKFRAIDEGLDEDANLLVPYLYDSEKGILPRIGDSILKGYTATDVSFGGHSRGGGVLSYAYTHGLLKDGDYESVVLIDPVVMYPKTDVPNVASLRKTKMRVAYFNDDESTCVTNGWPDTISAKFNVKDIKVVSAPECKHMDVCSSWGGILPLCHSSNGDECKARARDLIADAVFGAALAIV